MLARLITLLFGDARFSRAAHIFNPPVLGGGREKEEGVGYIGVLNCTP